MVGGRSQSRSNTRSSTRGLYLIIWIGSFEENRIDNVGDIIVEAENEADALRQVINNPHASLAHLLFNEGSVGDREMVTPTDVRLKTLYERLARIYDDQDLGEYDPNEPNHVLFVNAHQNEIVAILLELAREGTFLRIHRIN